MRRQDVLATILLVLLVLAFVRWALSTQSDLMREAKPIQVPPGPPQEAPPPAPGGARVLGPVTDDTRAAMDRRFQEEKDRKKKPPGH